METKTPTTGASSIKTFTVPAEMLQMFRADPRVLGHKPFAGYIIFDKEMMINAIRRGDAKALAQLADGLEKLGRNGGELVIAENVE
jgi:hypothetical protein